MFWQNLILYGIFILLIITFIGFIIFSFYLLKDYIDYPSSNFSKLRKIIAYIFFFFVLIGLFISGSFCKHIPSTNDIDAIPLITFLICSAILSIFIINDKIWNFISYDLANGIRYFWVHFRISVFKNFYYKNNKFTLEFVNENWQNNIYCFNNKNQVCLIREIDNLSSTTSFMKILYENFFNGAETTLNYEEFIKFANENDMFIRTYSATDKDSKNFLFSTATNKNSKKHINKILKENNIFIEPKKININTATENEITNLPFINIIHTKKIMKYIQENGSFKSFWDFAEFMNLKPNQGEILSKLVFVKPLYNNIKSENIKRKDIKLDI